MHSHSNLTTLQAAKELWNRCFHDDEAFTDFYFRRRYSDEIHMDIYEKGQMIAALQMLPYPMGWQGRIIPMAYISGACTHPDFRKQKVMRRLLNKTHRKMYRDGVGLSTLIPAEPWLFEYYASSGYSPIFRYQVEQIPASSLPQQPTVQVVRVETLSSSQADFVYKEMFRRNCSVLHTEKDLSDVLESYRMDGGAAFLATLQGVLCGVAWVVPQEGTIAVKELLTTHKEAADALLLASCRFFEVDSITCYKPLETDEGALLGMARLIDVPHMLQLFAKSYPTFKQGIFLEGDEALPTNNGYYTLQDGECQQKEIPGVEYTSHNLASLTQLLFASEHPYMSLMLD